MSKCIGNLCGGKWDRVTEYCRRVYDPEFDSPAVTAHGGGNQEVKILVRHTNGGNGYYKPICGGRVRCQFPNKQRQERQSTGKRNSDTYNHNEQP